MVASNQNLTGKRVAEVVFALPFQKTFDYLLPQPEKGPLEAGMRVLAPFGARTHIGMVVRLKASSFLEPKRLKRVLHAIDAIPVMSSDLLEFARWVAAHYFCGWGEAIDAALPSGIGGRIRIVYRWRSFPPAKSVLQEMPEGFARFLANQSVFSHDQLKKRGLNTHPFQWLRSWLQTQTGPCGALEILHLPIGGQRGLKNLQQAQWLRLTNQPKTNHVWQNPKRETRQQRLLRLLVEEGAVPLARVKTLISYPGPLVRSLQTQGIVEQFTQTQSLHFANALHPASPARTTPSGITAVLAKANPKPGALAAQVPTASSKHFLTLTPQQAQVFQVLTQKISQGGYHGLLLQGVTGSGKTEVYLHAVRETLQSGRNCLVLAPEIALATTLAHAFGQRFGTQVALLHSGLSPALRWQEWTRVQQNEARVVIGARSAVFAPLQNLGLVIVDEEHDGAYKQDEAPRYHGRDAALMRAYRMEACALLGTATPSMETLHNVALGKLQKLCLTQRIQARPLPKVELLHLKHTPRQPGAIWFTRPLADALRQNFLRKEQSLLFINRRGYATMAYCKACESSLLCQHCSIALTYHRVATLLRCHRCDYACPPPKQCPSCQAEHMEMVGLGAERLEEETKMLLPNARVLRLDGDTLQRGGDANRLLNQIVEHRCDIVIGTQVLSKGHHFPKMTLVGAVLADISLNLPDFRAPERTFQLLTQIAGRAGRGDLPGHVLIQTYAPKHYSLVAAAQHQVEDFAQQELRMREKADAPPFYAHALVWVQGKHTSQTEHFANEVGQHMQSAVKQFYTRDSTSHSFQQMAHKPPPSPAHTLRILGPVQAPIVKVNDWYRWMILLKGKRFADIQWVLHRALRGTQAPQAKHNQRIIVDVDPHQLL